MHSLRLRFSLLPPQAGQGWLHGAGGDLQPGERRFLRISQHL